MQKINIHPGFTLIEVIVSISIMSVILVAIMSVFFSMNDVSQKTDVQRQLQSNIKNAIETMSQDIRNNGVSLDCDSLVSELGEFWCDNTGNIYQIWKKDILWNFVPTTTGECSDVNTNCYLLRNRTPLTNSFVSIQDVNFSVLGDLDLPRLSISITLHPSFQKWVKANLIKNSTITLQTTLSESFLNQ